MSRTWKTAAVGLIASVVFCAPGIAKEKLRSLDGRVYVVEMVSQGNPGKKMPDEYTFGNRLLKNKHFASFGDALCVINDVSNATLFTAETRQTKAGKIKWIGAVKGSSFEATVIWYKSGSPPLIYIVKGKLKE